MELNERDVLRVTRLLEKERKAHERTRKGVLSPKQPLIAEVAQELPRTEIASSSS